MNKQIVPEILGQFRKLEDQRMNWQNTWDIITEYVLPHRGDFNIKLAQGVTRNRRLFDTTAVQANEFLASTLNGGLTNPSVKWFNLNSRNEELNRIEPVKHYLESATADIFRVINSPASNFQSQNHELFMDLVAYGTACMYVDDVPGEGIRFKAIHLSEVFIAEDKNGHVDTVFRKFKLTAKQAEQTWGREKLPQKILESLVKNPENRFEFIHCVKPNPDYDPEALNYKKRKFTSYHISLEARHVVDENGYFEMPYLVPRWSKLVGEIYGRSPAWSALADIRMINVVSKTLIIAAEKQVDPPLLMADDGVMMPLRTMPGGINYGGLDMNGRARIQPLQTGGNFNIGMEMLEQRAKAIRNAYFIDPLLNSPIKSNVTREEILQRQEEKLRLIGPQIGRIQAEYLSLLIERIYNILARNGVLQPLPDEIADLVEGNGIEVEYTSPLARTFKSNEPIALQRVMQSFLPLAQTQPEILDNVNFDRSFRQVSDILGVPLSMLNTIEERTAIRQARAQAQQQQQDMAMASEMASKAAELKKSGILDEPEGE